MNIIDSVFQGIYIPPVVFNVTEDEDGNPVRTCIDGKQVLPVAFRSQPLGSNIASLLALDIHHQFSAGASM